jgi:hypothetical protein
MVPWRYQHHLRGEARGGGGGGTEQAGARRCRAVRGGAGLLLQRRAARPGRCRAAGAAGAAARLVGVCVDDLDDGVGGPACGRWQGTVRAVSAPGCCPGARVPCGRLRAAPARPGPGRGQAAHRRHTHPSPAPAQRASWSRGAAGRCRGAPAGPARCWWAAARSGGARGARCRPGCRGLRGGARGVGPGGPGAGRSGRACAQRRRRRRVPGGRAPLSSATEVQERLSGHLESGGGVGGGALPPCGAVGLELLGGCVPVRMPPRTSPCPGGVAPSRAARSRLARTLAGAAAGTAGDAFSVSVSGCALARTASLTLPCAARPAGRATRAGRCPAGVSCHRGESRPRSPTGGPGLAIGV